GALAAERGVRLDRENHVQVTRRSTARPQLSLARDVHLLTLVDAGRNWHVDPALDLHLTAPPALRARLGDDFAGASTSVAEHDVHELSEDRLLRSPYLASAVARGATLGLTARLGARPV